MRPSYRLDVQQYSALEQQHSDLQQRYSDLEQQHSMCSDLQQQRSTLQKQCSTLQNKYSSLQQQHSALQQQHSTLQQQHSALQQQQQQNSTLQQKHLVLEQEHSILKQEHSTLQQTHLVLEQNYSSLKQQRSSLEQETNELQKESIPKIDRSKFNSLQNIVQSLSNEEIEYLKAQNLPTSPLGELLQGELQKTYADFMDKKCKELGSTYACVIQKLQQEKQEMANLIASTQALWKSKGTNPILAQAAIAPFQQEIDLISGKIERWEHLKNEVENIINKPSNEN